MTIAPCEGGGASHDGRITVLRAVVTEVGERGEYTDRIRVPSVHADAKCEVVLRLAFPDSLDEGFQAVMVTWWNEDLPPGTVLRVGFHGSAPVLCINESTGGETGWRRIGDRPAPVERDEAGFTGRMLALWRRHSTSAGIGATLVLGCLSSVWHALAWVVAFVLSAAAIRFLAPMETPSSREPDLSWCESSVRDAVELSLHRHKPVPVMRDT